MLIEVRCGGTPEVKGYVAVDSLVAGAAHGGLRISMDATPELLQRAARTMTLKYGWAGLPVGGAKAAIRADSASPAHERTALLLGFGSAVAPYLRSGMYVPGEDMGSSPEDIAAVLRAAGMRPLPRSLMYTSSGEYTGVGVCASALAAARHAGVPAEGMRIVVEGFGNVGSSAAFQFHRSGARVVAISTVLGGLRNDAGLDIPALVDARRELGDAVVRDARFGDCVAPDSLPATPAEVFCPCAIMHSLTMKNAGQLIARIVVPGANVPYTEEADRVLQARGVLAIPDFVANCGGVMGSSMSRGGLAQDRVASVVARRVGGETERLLCAAAEEQRSVRSVATELALKRFYEAKQRYEGRSPGKVAVRAAVAAYRHGLVPRPLLARAAGWYYDARWP